MTEASGYMFGKGVYFADMFSKSLGYCKAQDNGEAYLLLCEVALGKQRRLIQAQNNIHMQFVGDYPFQSVKALGKEIPRLSIMHQNGYSIPNGTPIKATNAEARKLLYNEYIVYDTNQFEIRYMVKVRVKKHT